MRIEGVPLGADCPVLLSDVGLFAGPKDLDGLSRLARKALSVEGGPPPAPGGPWPPVAEVGAFRGASVAVDLSGAAAEAEAMARLAELGVAPPWLSGDPDDYASGAFPSDLPDELRELADSLLDALCTALPGLEVDEWWRWTPPGFAFEAELSKSGLPAGEVWESQRFYVHASALAPFCCAFCIRTLQLRSADTTVSHLVDSGPVRAASEAACAALGELGFRGLSLRQAMRPVGPPGDGVLHEGPATLFDVLFGPNLDPYGKPSVTSRYGSAL